MISADDRKNDEELNEQEGEKPYAGLGEEPREHSVTEPDEMPGAEPVEGRFEVPVEDSRESAYADTKDPADAEEAAYAEETPYSEETPRTDEPGYTEERAGIDEPGYTEEPAGIDEPGYTEEPAGIDEPAYTEDSVDTEEPAYAGAPVSAEAPGSSELGERNGEPLLAQASAEAFLGRWSDVQVAFIEDPHRSVAEADSLLSEILTAYQEAVEQRRSQISADSADNAADTEHLRLALLDYRTIITAMLPARSS